MVDDLVKPKRRRRLSENYGKLYVGSSLMENEKPIWSRRLRQVLRGFSRADIVKVRPAIKGTPLCDMKIISEQAGSSLELASCELSVSEKEGRERISFIPQSATYERIQSLFDASEYPEVSAMTVRGLVFLTFITRALLYDRDADKLVKLWFDTEDDRLILYVCPENGIDESVDPAIKAMVLARTLGVQLDITRENKGIPCYKLVASACGEFLYNVRKIDEDALDEALSEGEEEL